MVCEECKQRFCVLCMELYHPGETCSRRAARHTSKGCFYCPQHGMAQRIDLSRFARCLLEPQHKFCFVCGEERCSQNSCHNSLGISQS